MKPAVMLLMMSVLGVSGASVAASAAAQLPLHSIPAFPLRGEGPVITRSVAAGEPFTVAGPQGMLAGQQQGTLEAWVLPVKLLSHLTLQADVEGYTVPLDLNSMAREIEVRPDRTTITYSHIAVTVRQIMFAPLAAPEGTGIVVLFQVDAVRPVTLTLRFTPELREMWPRLSSGNPSPEWVAEGTGGHYILHSDYPSLAAAIALPGATSGILAPYQERPQVHPLELVLHVDPARDRNTFFPLLMAVGRTPATATNAALSATLGRLNAQLPMLYASHAQRYAAQQQELTSIETPDPALDDDLTWAETSIAQLQATAPDGETGLVAGYYASGDSARPGFGWYFGRDTLYTVYAIDSYGDHRLARTALEFLLKRQRADGKAMHEYSQTAGELDWAQFPYEYAAADATPLLLTAMLDYVRSSGDIAFLRAHRDNILNAWHFETTHDSDGDGIYDNAQGTGWVEAWNPAAPEQEIYLALLDQQASSAMVELATLLDDPAVAQSAKARAANLHATIEREYYLPQTSSRPSLHRTPQTFGWPILCGSIAKGGVAMPAEPPTCGTYAFSRNVHQPANFLDASSTVFPAIAWWNDTPQQTGALDHASASLERWASDGFATDWGERDVAETDPRYDPISYHQGAVWPLFTGWNAIAQYRSGHPLAGYASLMQNANLTTAQDLGAVTELLSGAFYEPFGRSTSHQLWSSAMVVTPLLRGLFGLDVDALTHTLTVTPHLPATWPGATVHRLHIGDAVCDLTYKREGMTMLVTLAQRSGPAVTLQGGVQTLRLPLPAVELALAQALPLRGARTTQVKVIEEFTTAHELHLTFEGLSGTESVLAVQRNDPAAHVQADGATLESREKAGDTLHIAFTGGTGYVQQAVTLRW